MSISPSSSSSPVKSLPLPRTKRPWAVNILSGLLLLQAGGQLWVSLLNFAPLIMYELLTTAVEVRAGQVLSGAGMAVLALWTLGTALGFWALRPTAWLNAMLVQALTLATAIGMYIRQDSPEAVGVALLMMSYSLFVVLYLFQGDVQNAFRHKSIPPPAP